jgi:universal stress protein F
MKRILVALDPSERAPFVLEAAADLAQHLGAQMRLFTAVDQPPTLPTDLYAMSNNELPALLLENAKKALLHLSRNVSSAPIESVVAGFGTSWDAICSEAKSYDADIIVIGSHGYRVLDRVLGTTAAKVVNHAGCPVLVTRPKRYRK